jgi:uncharacterized delta-60 repeat protein
MKKLSLLVLSMISPFFLISQTPGTLDLSYGSNGYTLVDFGGTGNYCSGACIQDDQMLVLGGTSFNDTRDISFARLTAEGTLDVGFGSGGIITHVFGGSDENLHNILVQPDGFILGVGYTWSGGNYSMILVRLTPIGLFDPTFSSDGTVVVDFGPAYDSFGYDICLQDDGKILAVGYVRDMNLDNHCALCRLNPDGSMDNSFGTNGIVIMNFQSYDNYTNNVAIQGDKILVGGRSYNEGEYYLNIARFNSSGLLDATFGDNGVLTNELSMESVFITPMGKMHLDEEGRILYGCYYTGDIITGFAVYRFLSDGEPDLSFGDLGVSITVLEDDASIFAITTQYDGKILAGGSVPNGYALVRYLPDGDPDPSFGTNGNGIVYNYDLYRINALGLQEDGLIMAAGNAYAGNGSDFCAARYYSGLNVGISDPSSENSRIQIHPNPFMDHSRILFSLDQPAMVKTELYNAAGTIIQTWEPKPYPAGNHELKLDGSNLKSGPYFIRIFLDKSVYSSRMIKL